MVPVPWLVADGYIADYQNVLSELLLILVTSNWVKDMYIRDGIRSNNIEVLNEWIKAQDGRVMGVDWQTWSAALYLYAAKCVELRDTPFF
jgi:hypothetical protein